VKSYLGWILAPHRDPSPTTRDSIVALAEPTSVP
jgi:hypothetical protein